MRAAVYHAVYTDLQMTTLLPTLPTSFAIINAPELTADGIELETRIRHDDYYGVIGVAYSNARFTDFPNAPCFPNQTLAQGCRPVGLGSAQDVTGRSPPDSPRWSANLQLGWEGAPVGYLRPFAELQYSYKDEVHYSLGTNPADHEGVRELLNIGFGVRSDNGLRELRFFARNLFDQTFANRLVPNNGALIQYLPYESQASYGLALRFRR